MCSAVRLRMLVWAMAVSRSPARAAGWAAGAVGDGAGCARWGGAGWGGGGLVEGGGGARGAGAGWGGVGWGGASGAGAAATAPPWSRTESTSLRVIRPAGAGPAAGAGARVGR